MQTVAWPQSPVGGPVGQIGYRSFPRATWEVWHISRKGDINEPSAQPGDFRVTEVTRHFTATTFVVSGGRVLLHRHPKQGLWLPPGGHIERDELPHVAAVREVEEETGLTVHLHSEALAAQMAEEMKCAVVPQPAFILVEDINPFHQHIDFTYYAQVPAFDGARGNSAPSWRSNGFDWFSPDALTGDDVPENVRVGARHAIQYFERDAETH